MMFRYINDILNSPVALLGLLASIVVFISMCFNTTKPLGTICMRILNLIGSIISVIYSLYLGVEGIGMILLNGVLVFVNIYYIIITCLHEYNKKKTS